MSRLKRRRDARQATDSQLYQDRQQDIRAAAAKVFMKKGFVATKLSDVAEEAQMDRASLYYYVSSKQDLFESLFTSAIENNIETATEIATTEDTSLTKIERLIQELMISFERDYPYFYIFVQEDLAKIELLGDERNDKWLKTTKRLSREYFQIVCDIVSGGIEKGEISTTLPVRLVAHNIIGMVNGSSRWFRPNDVMPASEIGRGMAKMIVNGLRSS